MRASLTPHPDFSAPAITIEVDAERAGDHNRLSLSFRVTGDINAIRVPPRATPGRADELWRHTCFEAFVSPVEAEGYVEVNLSPSGRWAAYGFDGYRQGMRPAPAEIAPEAAKVTDSELILRASVDFGDLPQLTGTWRVALTAVIEAKDGSLSYWSLAHPPGKPDFHHRDCLALELAAPDGP